MGTWKPRNKCADAEVKDCAGGFNGQPLARGMQRLYWGRDPSGPRGRSPRTGERKAQKAQRKRALGSWLVILTEQTIMPFDRLGGNREEGGVIRKV